MLSRLLNYSEEEPWEALWPECTTSTYEPQTLSPAAYPILSFSACHEELLHDISVRRWVGWVRQ